MASDAGSSSDLGATCTTTQLACGGACVDPMNDRDHCGTCANACPAGNVCVAGSCSLGCPTGQTACNGVCINLQTDTANCGTCGGACPSGDVCSLGVCALTCAPSLAVCGGSDAGTDGGASAYCSDTHTDRLNCGACGNACDAGMVCTAGVCGISCVAGQTACGTSCSDLQTDNTNCGACSVACTTGQVCSGGQCAASCMSPYVTCGTGATAACTNTANDPAHCGGCTTACALPNAATNVCTAGVCGVGTCLANDGDCDGVAANGCETDLRTAAASCGACGQACAPANATGACSAGVCTVATCTAGYLDCDGLASNGCEVYAANNNSHCGACGTACTAGSVCSGGACGTTCGSPDMMCGTGASSVCTNTRIDPANCGACGTVCPSGASSVPACADSTCGILCNAGHANCDLVTSNGCEVNTLTSMANCGGCGSACAPANATGSCLAGVCTLVTCTTGYANCNGSVTDGCEANLATSTTNCGVCGNACSTGLSCVSGSCILVCPSGQTACSGTCRTLASDVNNCGTCGTICTVPANGTATCTTGACGITCISGYQVSGTTCVPSPPRPIAPLSTATVTSQRPTLHWSLPTGVTAAQVQICHDRACTTVDQTLNITGTSAAPTTALAAGVHFWRLYRLTGTTVGTIPSATWEFFVGHGSATVDTSWGTTLDVNGDGYGDVAVGAPGLGSSSGPTAVYVYPGSASGLATSPATTLIGPSTTSLYGNTVTSAGDINGDGFADLVVGGGGIAYVYLGGASGLATSPATTLSSFIGAVASAGDVNGDGYADLVAGQEGGNTVLVYPGSASGLVTTASITLTGPASSDFGNTLAGAGDVNGDGFPDVIIGTAGPNTAYIYLGTGSGLGTSPIVLTGPTGTSEYAYGLGAAGDLNGDGYADVVVGAPNANTATGAAYVYLGSASGTSTTATVLPGTSFSDFGWSVGSAGDVNGDGYGDLAVGTNGGGNAYVYLGSASGVSTTATTLTEAHGTYFGFAVACAGDVNGDGISDLVVGANSTADEAWVFLGGTSGISTTAITLTGPSSAAGYGHAVASAGGFFAPANVCMSAPRGQNPWHG